MFQQTPSGQPPTSSDPDKTVKRPYPTAPSTWGQTLPLADLLPGQESALFPSEEAERTVQVARSAFVKTLISGEGLSPPTPPPSVPQPRPTSERPPPARAGYSPLPDEPLTVPSNRPAPTPWQQSRETARTGTIPMPGFPGAHDDATAGQRNAGATSQARPAVQAAPASQARAVHASAKQTLPMGSAAITADVAGVAGASAAESSASTRAAKPASAAAPRANTAATPASAPSARAPRAGAPARAASIDHRSASEPLQLRIEERDVLQQPQMSERPVLPRNRGPLVAALLIATLLVLGAIAWFGLAKPAAPVAEPTRNDAVTVPAGQQPGAPTPTTAELAQPVAPTAPQPAATARPAGQPAQPSNSAPTQQAAQRAQPGVSPAQARESQTAAPAQPKSPRESTASRRRAERRAARRQAAEDQQPAPAPAAAADVPEDVQEARDALRALESDPVIKIKPAPSEEPEEPDFPSLPEPPEPPPPPDSE